MSKNSVWSERSPEARAKHNAASVIRNRLKRAADPEKARAVTRKSERKRKLKKYGLTEESYMDLLAVQSFLCGICKKPNTNKRDFHVDHCHETSIVRGVLCHHCNVMLGHAKDDITTLRNAIKYLERFQ